MEDKITTEIMEEVADRKKKMKLDPPINITCPRCGENWNEDGTMVNLHENS
jgi:hypothetical protein